MPIDSNSAIIDNDFINGIVDMQQTEEEMIFIASDVFGELNLTPLIHPLVLKHEVRIDHCRTKRLLEENVVKELTFKDIHNNDEAKKAYYSLIVFELYKKLTGESLNVGNKTVFDFWKKKQSLGEIHSLATCLLCGCGVFLSDDKDSKALKAIIEDTFLITIDVHSRQAVVALLREKKTSIPRKKLQSFSHVRT